MDILNARTELTGNLAKVKVLQELARLMEEGSKTRVLDIGCVGLQPLQFWEPLLDEGPVKFELYGIDIAGIKKAKELVTTKGWKNVRLQEGDGYFLHTIFEEGYFDVVVATQVLEHIAHLDRFLSQARRVVKPGGQVFFTLDSAHRSGKYTPRHPVKFLKNVVKKVLAWLGNERYYDLPLYDYEVERLFAKHSLKVLDKGFYNICPLKEIHNHKIERDRKNEFLKRWLELEQFLNQDGKFIEYNKRYFLGIYYRLQRVE